MSVQAISWVIEHSRHKGSRLVLLMMIANHAHSDGTGAWPSIETLARESRMSLRHVFRLLPKLERSGELKIAVGAGPHGTNLYSLPLLNWTTPDKLSADKRESPAVTNAAPKMSPEPSSTVLKPSGPAHIGLGGKLRGETQPNPRQSRADLPSEKQDLFKILKTVADGMDLRNASRRDDAGQQAQLASGIYRKKVAAAYFDCIHGGLGHEAGVRSAIHEAALSLTSNRGAVELRGLRLEELEAAAWQNLAAHVPVLGEICNYERRVQQVVGVVVSRVVEAALALRAPEREGVPA